MEQIQQTNLVALFVEDHQKITELLKDFKKHKSQHTKKSRETFKQLYEALKNHFCQEEILYSKYKHTTGEILPVLQTIKREHELIFDRLNSINQALNKGKISVEAYGLYPLLERHKNTEERLLYPELERALSEKEKEEVYWKIRVG